MQDYYEQEHVFGDIKSSSNLRLQLSFVGTLCLVSVNGLSPFCQILASILGTKAALVIGTVCVTGGLITAGFATEIWHLYLTQGIFFGAGVCLLYVMTTVVASQYFTRKRGFALGIISSGTGFGGLVMPFVMTPINRTLGGTWTYRILAIICSSICALACILVKDRVPQQHKERKRLREIIKFEVLKNVDFRLWFFGAMLQISGYFVPYFIIPTIATFLGLTDSQGSSLVAIGSGMSFIGRITCGFLADLLGPINMNILFLTICGLSCFLIWTFADTYAVLVAFMAVFGFTAGTYFTLQPTITAAILGIEKIATGISIIMLGNAIGLFAPNLTSALDNSGISSVPFLPYKMFTGVVYILAVIIMLCIKLRINRRVLARV